jgi:hypothetical protein
VVYALAVESLVDTPVRDERGVAGEVRAALGFGVVTLLGQRGIGKSHLVATAEPNAKRTEPWLVDFDRHERRDPLETLAEAVSGWGLSRAVRPSAAALLSALRDLFQASVPRRLVLEHVESVVRHGNFNQLIGLVGAAANLRAEMQSQVTFVLTSRTPSGAFPFGRAIALRDFSRSEVEVAVSNFGASVASKDVEGLTERIGCNPGLVDAVVTAAVRSGRPVLDIIEKPRSVAALEAASMRAVDWANGLAPNLLAELQSVLRASSEARVMWNVQHPSFIRGYALGVLSEVGNVRYPFYRSLLRHALS